jgi:hypothetical protein
MKSVKAYRSQVIEGRSSEHPTVLDDIRDRARYWGWTIGKAYAEPLTNREQVGIRSLNDLC